MPIAPSAPGAFSVASQRALLGGSEFQLSWAGTASSYKVSIGASQGASDVAIIETDLPMHTWRAPRAGTYFATVTAKTDVGDSPSSASLTLVSVDLRDVIDAMLFGSGPLSDYRTVTPIDSPFSIWPDGQRITILVAPDLAPITLSRINEFAAEFEAVAPVNGSIAFSQNNMKAWTVAQVPAGTIAVRFMTPAELAEAGICTIRPGVGCNTGGPPAPGCGCLTANIGRAITTLHTPDAEYVKHELGHAYGMFHITLPSGTKLARTLMGPGLIVNGVVEEAKLSETEGAAIAALRQNGFGRGGRRSQLIAAGLINR